MTILDFLALALCTDAIATAWFYSELFDRPREYFVSLKARGGWFFGTLFTCTLCLAYHISFWATVLLWLPGCFLESPWDAISRIPIYSLAVTTIVHFLQQIRPFDEEEEDGSEDGDTGDS